AACTATWPTDSSVSPACCWFWRSSVDGDKHHVRPDRHDRPGRRGGHRGATAGRRDAPGPRPPGGTGGGRCRPAVAGYSQAAAPGAGHPDWYRLGVSAGPAAADGDLAGGGGGGTAADHRLTAGPGG